MSEVGHQKAVRRAGALLALTAGGDCLYLHGLYIKEIQLVGFKSFQDKATLRLAPGMNSIVGPNGCGKSNILDALRWVLGEQSFSVLRCARNEDLIFGGTATIPATNMAEVRLVLSTEDRPDLGVEVEIRRRYFRSGESEYSLNRQPCRLRDILDLFLSAGIGTKAYSIFDLRQIREIISGNVRRMFEEAASLAKYQEAKADCLRKLELTATDLVRLDDIIAERERVVRSLRRQAGRLRACQKLKEEEKSYRLVELKLDYDALGRDLGRVRADVGALEKAEADRLAETRRLEEEMRNVRTRVREAQARREELLAEARQKGTALAELEGRSLLDRQRAEMLEQSAAETDVERERLAETAAQMERLFGETIGRLAESAGRVGAAEQRLEDARQRTRERETRLFELRQHEQSLREQLQESLGSEQADRQTLARLEATEENLAEGLERSRAEMTAAEARTAKAQGAAAEASQRAETVVAAVAELRGRIGARRGEMAEVNSGLAQARTGSARLRDERAGIEQEQAVLRAAVATEQARIGADVLRDNLTGEVCSFLDVADGWETACEAALYPVLEFLFAGRGVTQGELARLADAGPGLRFGFIVPHPTAPGRFDVPSDPEVAGRLSDYVKVRPGGPGLLGSMLASFLVAREGTDISALVERHSGWSFVTQDGLAHFADGRMVLEGSGRGRLSAERRLKALAGRLAEVTSAEAGLQTEEQSLARRRGELDSELSLAEAALVEAERAKAGQDAAAAAVAADVAGLQAEQARLEAEVRNADGQRRTVGGKAAALRAKLTEAGTGLAGAQRAAQSVAAQVAELEAAVRQALDESAEALAALGEERQQVSRLETERDYAKRTLDETRRGIAARQTGAETAREEARRLRAEVASRVEEVAGARQVVAEVEAAAAAMAGADAAAIEETLEANITELREQQERNRNLLMEQRMKQYDFEKQAAAIADEVRGSHGADVATLPAQPVEDFQQRYDQVRHRLEALGAVNPLAVEEYEQEKRDLGRLVSQRSDVQQAKVNLEQTLLEIDRHAREQFVATYGEVRMHFQQVFRDLFLEGDADLVLVNEASPLESEIAIVARPKGKTPKRLEQLSDGEKALLAVSLLFAFYRVKPAPFCFLDEVDAPLDDINVGRFADYLKHMSETTQVIIITHNRATVERADSLFGVTAEQPGVSQLVSVSLAQFRAQQPGGSGRPELRPESGEGRPPTADRPQPD